MELRLKHMAPIGTDRVDPEWELLDDVVDETGGILLVVTVVDFERSHPCGIINGRVLEAANSMPVRALKAQNLHVCLHMMARDLFRVPMRVDPLSDPRGAGVASVRGAKGSPRRLHTRL